MFIQSYNTEVVATLTKYGIRSCLVHLSFDLRDDNKKKHPSVASRPQQRSNSGRISLNVCRTVIKNDCCQKFVFFPFIDCSKLLQEASQKCSHCREFLPFSSASQDSGISFLEKTASGRRSFTSTWFPTPAAAPPAAESTQRSSTASGSSSSLDPSSDTESRSSSAGQLRSPTQRPASSDQGQLETLYEGPPGSPTAFLKFNPPYKRRSKNTSNNSSALLFIFGS